MRIGFTVFAFLISFILAPLADAGVAVYTAVNANKMKADLSISVSAVVTNSEGQRVGGIAVNWSIAPPTDPPRAIFGAGNPTVTDMNGRTSNTVHGQGIPCTISIVANAGSYGTGQASLDLTSTIPVCTLIADPFRDSWKSDHPCTMTFKDDTNNSFSNEIPPAVQVWNDAKCGDNLHHVQFTPGLFAGDISIQTMCIADLNLYSATTRYADGSFVVRLNIYVLDGFLTPPGSICFSDYPRDTGFVKVAIAHELGHPLGLEDNFGGVESGALRIECWRLYFVCGTSKPTSAEMTTICGQYPNPCG